MATMEEKNLLEVTVAMDEKSPFENAFGARHIFLTGATGMLGTALLVKLTKDTTISQIHVLVRGGEGTYLTCYCCRHYRAPRIL
jgi:FlaA1/EpsC-like NDP-sugar epimerase